MKPSVEMMLRIGRDMGHDDIDQAYFDFMRHYDVFFLIEKYDEQYSEFLEEMKKYDLLQYIDGKMYLKQITIEEAIAIVEKYNESKD